MSEPFYRLPSKRIYPDYYEEIRNPVSLTQICKKLQVCLFISDILFPCDFVLVIVKLLFNYADIEIIIEAFGS